MVHGATRHDAAAQEHALLVALRRRRAEFIGMPVG
jgi:hypothetical protein